MAAAAAEAEALFRAQGKLPEAPTEHISTTVRAQLAAEKKAAKGAPSSSDENTRNLPEDTLTGAQETRTKDAPEAGSSSGRAQAEETGEGKNDDLPEVDDMEHLQLTLQEAFFLCWCFGCLSVLDPKTVRDLCPFPPPLS